MQHILSAFADEQVFAYPTEAVFGLGCNPMSETAVMRLLDLKQRSLAKGLILIAPHLDFLLPFIDSAQLRSQHWAILQQPCQQATTWLVPKSKNTPDFLTGQFEQIAVRICPHSAVQQICNATHSAITSTSANLSGLLACRTAQEVRDQFGHDFPVVDMAVGGAKNPSQIKDLLTQELIRQG